MKLKTVKYSQFAGKPNEWNLDPLDLGPMNLIVGKNASGKTKTLNLIHNLAKLLCGERKPDFSSAHFDVSFEHEHNNYRYLVNIEKGAVIEEKLEIDGDEKLVRSHNGVGKIFAEKLGKSMDFQAPVSELAFTVRRDNIQHPYFEPLYEWAKSVYYYAFGTSLGRNAFAIIQKEAPPFDPKNPDLVVGIYKNGEKEFSKSFKTAVIKDMASIGYDISDVGIDTPSNIVNFDQILDKWVWLWVQEKDLKCRTEQAEISQGMFRALSLIIQLNYSIMAHKPSSILIDDIGEGLDFERSSAFIKLLMSKTNKSKVQLIMATNDRFVMNMVPLDTWTVLYREGSRCRVYNAQNSKEKFEEFRFTGLNNFDFFATNYLTTEKK